MVVSSVIFELPQVDLPDLLRERTTLEKELITTRLIAHLTAPWLQKAPGKLPHGFRKLTEKLPKAPGSGQALTRLPNAPGGSRKAPERIS